MNIRLCKMSKELARAYFKKLHMDPALLIDGQEFREYEYSDEKSDAAFDRHLQLGRVYLAVMLHEEPIGEIILKNIDPEEKHCRLSICICSDEFKNKGYGTKAEMLALEYAFEQMNMNTVFADAVRKNTRSRHVLEKVGFMKIHQDDTFTYYRCDKEIWTVSNRSTDLY